MNNQLHTNIKKTISSTTESEHSQKLTIVFRVDKSQHRRRHFRRRIRQFDRRPSGHDQSNHSADLNPQKNQITHNNQLRRPVSRLRKRQRRAETAPSNGATAAAVWRGL